MANRDRKTLTVRFPRGVMEVVEEVAEVAGKPVRDVLAVVLAFAVVREMRSPAVQKAIARTRRKTR